MASLKHIVSNLQQRNSKSHVAFLVFLLLFIFGLAIATRYYVLEPLKIVDSSMYPRHKESSILWMCKLPQCIDKIKSNESVWAKLRNQETLVRKVIAMPGDSLSISDNGKVQTKDLHFKWTDENAFIQSRTIYIPQKGDTLYLDSLNDIEEDYALSLLQEQGEKIFIKTTLWQGSHELSLERVGATKLGNRQVSLQEINLLPWQDRYLIELQIRQSEPGNHPIKLRRQFFREADSTQITQFTIQEDCYYVACERGAHCVDSRETGYITKNRLLGRHIKYPDKIKAFARTQIKKFFQP